MRTDPTYKEWKPLSGLYRWQPIRWMHGSYLQGMETKLPLNHQNSHFGTDPTYKEWKLYRLHLRHKSVVARILPTRNGNKSANKRASEFSKARILPTRNGNSASWRGVSYLTKQGTDPTYKEWKLFIVHISFPPLLARILPTRNGNLERWKCSGKPLGECTDPTYKEWKQD